MTVSDEQLLQAYYDEVKARLALSPWCRECRIYHPLKAGLWCGKVVTNE